jgi:hypothetical protein
MPDYKEATRDSRFQMREKVREFLESKVGKELVPECTTWARSAVGELFSTLGIPFKYEEEFMRWATGVLRDMFGRDAVPLQSWESGTNSLDIQEEEEDILNIFEEEEEDTHKEELGLLPAGGESLADVSPRISS